MVLARRVRMLHRANRHSPGHKRLLGFRREMHSTGRLPDGSLGNPRSGILHDRSLVVDALRTLHCPAPNRCPVRPQTAALASPWQPPETGWNRERNSPASYEAPANSNRAGRRRRADAFPVRLVCAPYFSASDLNQSPFPFRLSPGLQQGPGSRSGLRRAKSIVTRALRPCHLFLGRSDSL